jgi:formate dehydrogenase iron-sulfur subunit
VACKSWNGNIGENTHNMGSYENPPTLSSNTWTLVRFNEVEYQGRFSWVFYKIQCMHCLHPACVSVCTVGALQKSAEGPVTYDADRCIGCRYCEYGCPFGVPKFQWDRKMGLITKCTFCNERLEAGLKPACVQACPGDALVFGDRQELITQARARIAARPEKYVNHVYGETELGGTSWMYLSPVPFEMLGFNMFGDQPLTGASESIMSSTPISIIAAVAALGGFYWLTSPEEEEEESEEDEPWLQ